MKLLTALAITAVMFASSASAFDPDDLQKLKDTGFCVGCALFKAILSGANLSRANLNGAWLRKADLSEANLSEADLSEAYLSGADLTGANLNEADLTGAIMKHVILCNTTMPDGSVIYSGC